MTINIKFENFTIEIFDDHSYKYESTDSINKYNDILGNTNTEPSSKHALLLKYNGKIMKSLMLLGSGGSTCIHQKCYKKIDKNLYICVGDSIYKIYIPELRLVWSIKIDDATAFQINRMYDDLIVHGELSISRINQNGDIIWQNYGSDIFVTESGENNFKIVDNKIYARSWDNRNYVYNFDGST